MEATPTIRSSWLTHPYHICILILFPFISSVFNLKSIPIYETQETS